MRPPAPGDVETFQVRAGRQQRRLLVAAAPLVGPYYVAAWATGIYPTSAMLVGLCLPASLLAAAWRVPAAGPREARAWPFIVTVGFSAFALTTAALGAATACIGFQVVWALPLLYVVLVPYSRAALGAGAAVSVSGGLALMLRDGHPAAHVAQWGAMAVGALAFAAHRVSLNRSERDAFQEQERRQAMRVASSEEHYRLLADHARDVIWTLDLASRRFTYVSPSVERQRGFTVAEAMAQRLEDALTPASLEQALTVLGRIGTPEEEDPHTGIYQQPCRDGSTRHVEITATLARDAAGRPLAVTGASRDVSGRVEAEGALRRSEARFRALIEKSSDLIVVLDAETRITFWSAGAAGALGWTPDEVLGRTLGALELVHPDDAPTVSAATAEVVSERRPTMRVRARLRHRDGSWRQVEGLQRNLLGDAAVGGVVFNARDVTDQDRLAEQMRQAQKLESIGRLAGGAAHDFNNLLTVMLSCTHALRADAEAGRPVDPDTLSELRDAGLRARQLTRQLLAFARRQPIEMVSLDLADLIRGAEPMLRRVLGEEVTLALELGPGPWPVLGDPGPLEQVLLNLALNARDAMLGVGTLTIGLRREVLDAEVSAPGRPPGDWVRLEVIDSGTGMSDEVRRHLFEPFFTTKAQGEGTGLGLATAYGIVKQHGGHIQADGAPRRGTAFVVLLPAWSGEARAPAVTSATATPGGTEAILVMDDDDLVRIASARMLRGAGYQVRVASSGVEALAQVDGPAGAPHLILSDVIMPGMRGPEAVRRLRERIPGLAVLFMSGHAGDALSASDLAQPRTGFIAKPFMPEELLSAVRALLDAPSQADAGRRAS